MNKRNTIDSCWFSEGDIVLIQEPGIRERYAVVKQMESDGRVCVNALMTGRSIHSVNWRSHRYSSRGFVERYYQPSLLKAVCRRSRHGIGYGDMVVVFPVPAWPHYSAVMRIKQGAGHESWGGLEKIKVHKLGDQTGESVIISRDQLYLPAGQPQKLSAGNSVMLNHGADKGLIAQVREIETNGLISVEFNGHRFSYSIGDLLKLTSFVFQQQAMCQNLPVEVVTDKDRPIRTLLQPQLINELIELDDL